MQSNTTAQTSDANPGWKGSGIPTLHTLLVSRPKRIVSGRSGGFRASINLIVASLADLWNFYLYRRSRVVCPCCGWSGSGFLASSNWRAISFQSKCPACDSRSRHRGQIRYLQAKMHELQGRRTLLFAPEKVILTALASIGVADVVTTDFASIDVDLPNQNIEKLSIDSDTFDLLICNHVLEHVPDDGAAIAECARVLKPNGVALFTIPGDFDQESTCQFDKTDSNGHYRHYAMDVLTKFEGQFHSVEMTDMSTLAKASDYVRKGDMLFVCKKALR